MLMVSDDKRPTDDAHPLFIVLNAGSGKTDPSETRAIMEDILSSSGRAYEIHVVEKGDSLEMVTQRVVEQAARRNGAVVAAGGDGTISTVARAALSSGCLFGMVPQGTFNYFGRANKIPEDTAAAVNVLLAGRPRPVQVGMVNGTAFLVNASLGLHPQMLEDREAFTRQFGRSRLVAIWSSLRTLLHYHLQLRLRIELHGESRKVRTPTLFVCNNTLQMEQLGIPLIQEVEHGRLAAMMLHPVSLPGMLWLALRGAFGHLGDARNVISFSFERMNVRQPGFYGRRRVKVGIDGELRELESPIEFRVSPQPLMLLAPAGQ